MKHTYTHTQGPWRSNCPQITAQGDMALTVAVVLSREDNNARADSAAKTKGEAEANARLIAAAPDLLAALVRVLDFEQRLTACKIDGGAALVSDIRAALAKAEGNI